jgi:hypothetical protein
MHLSLHISTTKQVIGAFNSPVVPRSDELIDLDGSLFQVKSVCYRVAGQECNCVDLEVHPANDTALQYVSRILLAI